MSTFYYVDNLKILRAFIEEEPVDLVYLDPLFNSNRNSSILIKDETGAELVRRSKPRSLRMLWPSRPTTT